MNVVFDHCSYYSGRKTKCPHAEVECLNSKDVFLHKGWVEM